MAEVYDVLYKLRSDGQSAALVTIILAKGSTPQGQGAKMVVAADGRIYGTIGGGCVEANVQRAALDVIRQGIPLVMQVDLTAEAAADEGDVCGGVLSLFIEPVIPKDA